MMKSRAFSILTGLALLSMPLFAQYAEEQPKPAAPVEEAASLDVDADMKDAAGNIDPEVDVKTGAEARADVDTEATDDDDSDVAAAAATEELPQTASPLALLALLGMGAGTGALGLRRFRRN